MGLVAVPAAGAPATPTSPPAATTSTLSPSAGATSNPPTIASPTFSTPADPNALGPYDIEAVGASVAGRVGSVVQIKVGLINHGPYSAWGHAGVMGGFQGFGVTLPAGVTVIGQPRGCENRDMIIQRSVSASGCPLARLVVGESILLILDLRIVGRVTGPGRVTRTFTPGPAPFPNQIDQDTNPANNTADIVIHMKESGPALADTGPPAATLRAAGTTAVIVGTLLVLISRRRTRRPKRT